MTKVGMNWRLPENTISASIRQNTFFTHKVAVLTVTNLYDVLAVSLFFTYTFRRRLAMNRDVALQEAAAHYDHRLGLEPGVSLTVAHHLLATRQ